MNRLAVQLNLAGIDRVCRNDRAERLRPACAGQSCQAQNFSSVELQGNMIQRALPAKIRHLQDSLTVLTATFRVYIANLSTDHFVDQQINVVIFYVSVFDQAAVTHDRDCRAQLENLFHSVGNVNKANALACQLMHEPEKALQFALR